MTLFLTRSLSLSYFLNSFILLYVSVLSYFPPTVFGSWLDIFYSKGFCLRNPCVYFHFDKVFVVVFSFCCPIAVVVDFWQSLQWNCLSHIQTLTLTHIQVHRIHRQIPSNVDSEGLTYIYMHTLQIHIRVNSLSWQRKCTHTYILIQEIQWKWVCCHLHLYYTYPYIWCVCKSRRVCVFGNLCVCVHAK